MKKVLVLDFVIDSDYASLDDSHILIKRVVENWVKTDQGKFIETHSLNLEMRMFDKHDTWSRHIEIWATLEEKIETFWRLKFK